MAKLTRRPVKMDDTNTLLEAHTQHATVYVRVRGNSIQLTMRYFMPRSWAGEAKHALQHQIKPGETYEMDIDMPHTSTPDKRAGWRYRTRI